jgi:hypothetical protein
MSNESAQWFAVAAFFAVMVAFMVGQLDGSPVMRRIEGGDRREKWWQRRSAFGTTMREQIAWALVLILGLVVLALLFPNL